MLFKLTVGDEASESEEIGSPSIATDNDECDNSDLDFGGLSGSDLDFKSGGNLSDDSMASTDVEASDNLAFEPLYEGSNVSIFDSHVLCLQLALKHSLTDKAFSDVLQLVSAHLPDTSKSPKSVYLLKKFFLNLFPQVTPIVHAYCSFCLKSWQDGLDVCCDRGSREEFISLPIKPQLKRIMEGIYL